MILLTRIPFIRREFVKRIKGELIKPYANTLKRTQ